MCAAAPPSALREQVQLQARAIARRRWILVVPTAVLLLAAAGLLAVLRAPNVTPPHHVAILGAGTVLFGIAAISLALEPWRRRPRVVPCFSQQVGEPLEPGGAAFRRGHALFREMGTLDQLAAAASVAPLSTFGFADDAWGGEVHWHPAPSGLATVAALLEGRLAEDVTADLRALQEALEAANSVDASFALMVRLHGGDMQSAAIFEKRQGRFW
jgi:hypothetical protein